MKVRTSRSTTATNRAFPHPHRPKPPLRPRLVSSIYCQTGFRVRPLRPMPALLAFEHDELVTALLQEEQARAERLLNVVRAVVLILMTGIAMVYAPSLTPAL